MHAGFGSFAVSSYLCRSFSCAQHSPNKFAMHSLAETLQLIINALQILVTRKVTPCLTELGIPARLQKSPSRGFTHVVYERTVQPDSINKKLCK